MKTLKFKDFKAQMILKGEKYSSIRLFDDKSLSVGDKLVLINSDSGETFANAEITKVTTKQIRDIQDVDLEGHEKWESREAMLHSLKTYYGNEVTDHTEAKIVLFKLY